MLCIVGNNDNAKGCVMDVDIRWRVVAMAEHLTHVVHIGQLSMLWLTSPAPIFRNRNYC